jgi:hypothetical protein
MNNNYGENNMNVVKGMERLELIECVQMFGFAKGSEIYWIHKFKNLPENQHKSRRQLEVEMLEMLRIPKCSKSTFDKTYGMYNKILPKLMTREVQSKLEIFDKQGANKNEDKTTI